MVCPGLFGAHEHYLHGLFGALNQVASLAQCATLEAVRLVLVDQLAHQATGTVMAVQWNSANVPVAALTRDFLDTVGGGRTILVWDQSFHACVVSSSMLRQLETRGFPPRIKGSNSNGYLTEEYAMFAMAWLEYERDHFRRLLVSQQEIFFSHGFTRIADKDVLGHGLLGALVEAYDDGTLVLPCEGSIQSWMIEDGVRPLSTDNGLFNINGIKDYADGAFGARTAACAPHHYHGTEDTGLLMRTPEQLQRLITLAHRHGFGRVGVHCIGPEAIRLLAGVYTKALDEMGGDASGVILGFEHFEAPDLATVQAVAKMQRAGVPVEVVTNPTFNSDIGVYGDRLDETVLRMINPYRTFGAEGLIVQAGTDGIPTQNPWTSMGWAVDRPAQFGEENVPVEDAFGMYADGTLEVGKPATFIITDRDFIRRSDEVGQVQVRETWIGGDRVWRRGHK